MGEEENVMGEFNHPLPYCFFGLSRLQRNMREGGTRWRASWLAGWLV